MTPQEQVRVILAEFDFEEAHNMATLMGWTYGRTAFPPDVRDLEDAARRNLERLVSHEDLVYCSSGRFTAAKLGDGLHLFFGLEACGDGES